MSNIFVTNNGDIPFKAKYGPEFYDFPAGQEVEIPLAVAKHVFGYGDDNKEPYFVRLGWMKMNTDFQRAMDRLSEFKFSAQSTKVHVSAPVVERVAAPLPKARGAAKVTKSDE
jgi:hypothetical protein